MPTYEYRCAKCGEELEVFQTFAEAPLTKHKGCGGKLAKVLSPAGIVLKGSGFYKTDNRSSSKRAGGSDSRSSESRSSESGSSGESKSSESSGSSSSGNGSSGDSKKSDSSSSGSGGSGSGGSGDSKKPAAKSA
jgi:putative FmdB family regulatory protein